ncbi:hypothetical protein [Micromonospora sp. NPDC093277]|uniref:hypothetical protein n=1 Tax=Micromonospora sp. NPDC093277 TaxID=3364291 RepID=UPI003808DA75
MTPAGLGSRSAPTPAKVRGRKRRLLVGVNGRLLACVVHSASIPGPGPEQTRPDQHHGPFYPNIGLIWGDGGYASIVYAELTGVLRSAI